MLSVSSVFRNRGTAKKSIILISEMTTVISMRVNPLFFSGFIIMVLRQFGTKRMNNRHNVSFHRCCTKDGKVKEAKGRAWVMDKKTPAKLKVSFFSLFGFIAICWYCKLENHDFLFIGSVTYGTAV